MTSSLLFSGVCSLATCLPGTSLLFSALSAAISAASQPKVAQVWRAELVRNKNGTFKIGRIRARARHFATPRVCIPRLAAARLNET
jgi:hypothetical protein